MKTKFGLKRHVAQHENPEGKKGKSTQGASAKPQTSKPGNLTIRDVISKENNSTSIFAKEVIKPSPRHVATNTSKAMACQVQVQIPVSAKHTELLKEPEIAEETVHLSSVNQTSPTLKEGMEKEEIQESSCKESAPEGNPDKKSLHFDNEAGVNNETHLGRGMQKGP